MYVTKWNTYFNFYGLGDGVSYTTYDMSPLPISKVTILYLVTSLTQFGREEAEQDFITVMTDQRRPGYHLRRVNHLKAPFLLSGIK
jgi:hypothetical protein